MTGGWSKRYDLRGGCRPLFYISKRIYPGMPKKGGGNGYPQALLEGLTSEAKECPVVEDR